jgi:hypothetical protein
MGGMPSHCRVLPLMSAVIFLSRIRVGSLIQRTLFAWTRWAKKFFLYITKLKSIGSSLSWFVLKLKALWLLLYTKSLSLLLNWLLLPTFLSKQDLKFTKTPLTDVLFNIQLSVYVVLHRSDAQSYNRGGITLLNDPVSLLGRNTTLFQNGPYMERTSNAPP